MWDAEISVLFCSWKLVQCIVCCKFFVSTVAVVSGLLVV